MTAMRLAVRFLGLDLLDVCIETAEAVYETADAVESPGDCATYPVGFTAAHEIPDQAGPFREGWE